MTELQLSAQVASHAVVIQDVKRTIEQLQESVFHLNQRVQEDESTFPSLFKSFVRRLAKLEIVYSNQSTPGGGAHSAHFYGSPSIEQAAALGVRTQVLGFIRGRSVPHNSQEHVELLNACIDFVQSLRHNNDTVWVPHAEPAKSWSDHFRAPSITAFGAMRQKVLSFLLEEILLQ
jgi:hypothetical protein